MLQRRAIPKGKHNKRRKKRNPKQPKKPNQTKGGTKGILDHNKHKDIFH
jgi:hypothetical protein